MYVKFRDELTNFRIDRGTVRGASVCEHAFVLVLQWTDQPDPAMRSAQVINTFSGIIPVVPGDTRHMIFRIIVMECIKKRAIPAEGAAVAMFFWLEPNEFSSDIFPESDATEETIVIGARKARKGNVESGVQGGDHGPVRSPEAQSGQSPEGSGGRVGTGSEHSGEWAP